ncbi:MAG: hypothetical protein AAGC95_08155 [Pseudomonadota bacterium]
MTKITERAMLVALNISQWSARKYDKRASEDVAKLHGADAEMMNFTKHLVDKSALRNITLIARAAREHHLFNTLPWSDSGFRMLPGANYFDYVEAQQAYRSKFDRAVADFTNVYKDCVAEARERLKGLFSMTDYPLPEEVANKFGIDCVFAPLPDGDDFRVSLGAEEERRIREEIEERARAAEVEAMRDLWTRVHAAVARMSKNLNSYGTDPVTGRITHPFRDSMVDSLRKLVETLPKLNVAGDSNLEAMRQRLVQDLCPHDPQDLRDDDILRKAVAQEADVILHAMADYVGVSDDEEVT